MRTRIALLFAVVAMLMTVTAPAATAAPPTPVGPQLSLFAPPATFPADTPFHVIHGWGIGPLPMTSPGHFSFELDLDGVPQASNLVNTGVGLTGGPLVRLFLTNYPDGLPAGDHVFTGRFLAPCDTAVAVFGFPGPCPQPNAEVVVLTLTIPVTFN